MDATVLNDAAPLTLATHSGKFHCDEVFAYAVLRLALGLGAPGSDHRFLRTRKQELIEAADIVWDVGGVFDVETSRFDHHQRGAPLREDSIVPFSSAGMVWRVYGERAVAAILPAGAEGFAAAIAAELDSGIVRRLDEIDTGVSADGLPITRDSLGLARLVEDCNPTWDDAASNGPTAGDEAFQEAALLVEGVLRRRIEGMRARHEAESIILAAHGKAVDPRVLVLERGMPWKNVVFHHHLPVLFTISPASNGNWMLDTVPPEPGSFDQKLSLPENWAGLQNAELAAESGVADAVFVHLRRFVGAAKTREGALEMARLALAAA